MGWWVDLMPIRVFNHIVQKAGAYTAHTFFIFCFFLANFMYVPFVPARDHLGKLVMEK